MVSFVEPSAQNLDLVRALFGCVAELFLAHLDELLAHAGGLLLAMGSLCSSRSMQEFDFCSTTPPSE